MDIISGNVTTTQEISGEVSPIKSVFGEATLLQATWTSISGKPFDSLDESDFEVVDGVLKKIAALYSKYDTSTIDGVKINMDQKRSWAQLRKSNTEPIIRLYCEAPTKKQADAIAKEIIAKINDILKNSHK